jgi:hypothetical protein
MYYLQYVTAYLSTYWLMACSFDLWSDIFKFPGSNQTISTNPNIKAITTNDFLDVIRRPVLYNLACTGSVVWRQGLALTTEHARAEVQCPKRCFKQK